MRNAFLKRVAIAATLAFSPAAALVAHQAVADDDPFAAMTAITAMMQPVTLTPATVDSFIKSYAAVKAGAPAIGKKYGVEDSDDIMAGGGFGALLAVGGAMGELNGLVTPYGFADFMTWTRTAMSVATAYSFARDNGEMEAGMQEALDGIKNNPSLSEEQKQAMLQQLTAASTVASAMRPPQANVDAVKPYIDQLTGVLN